MCSIRHHYNSIFFSFLFFFGIFTLNKTQENKPILSVLSIVIWILDVGDSLKIYFFSVLVLSIKCDKAVRSHIHSNCMCVLIWFLVTRLFNIIILSIRTRQFLWHQIRFEALRERRKKCESCVFTSNNQWEQTKRCSSDGGGEIYETRKEKRREKKYRAKQ